MSGDDPRIFHLALASELRGGIEGALYRPASLAENGFVHCAGEASVLPVANDYYADAPEPLLLVEIDSRLVAAETRFEAAAPIEGGGTDHLESAASFPHVYGPIDTPAIRGVGVLALGASGYEWPARFASLADFLAG